MGIETDTRKFLFWATMAGALAGVVNIGFWITIPRSAFLAFVLAWWLKRIYRIENGEAVGVHSWWRVLGEGLLAGLVAGIPLAGMSWIAYAQGWFKSSELPGISELIIVPPLTTLLVCLVYGTGLTQACRLLQRDLWRPWLAIVPTTLLAGFLKVGLSSNTDTSQSWVITIPCGALPFCLLWLGVVLWKEPYRKTLRNRSRSSLGSPL